MILSEKKNYVKFDSQKGIVFETVLVLWNRTEILNVLASNRVRFKIGTWEFISLTFELSSSLLKLGLEFTRFGVRVKKNNNWFNI